MLPIISQARFMTKTRSHHVIPGPAFSRVLLRPKFHNATVAWGEGTRDAICTLWVWNQLLKEYTVGRCGYRSLISELVWDAVRFLEAHRTAGVGLILQYTEADFCNPLNRPMP